MKRLYVYALLDGPVRPVTMAGRRVETVKVDAFYAAVERVSRPPRATESALQRQHDIVACLSRRTDAILPARFGALVDADELARVLRHRRRAIARALSRVRGHQQMTVRIFQARPARQNRSPATGGTPGARYLRRRRAELAPRPGPAVRAIGRAVRDLRSAERRATSRDGAVTTLFHLVWRGTSRAYRARLRRLSLPSGLDIVVSGPFPPYAFAPESWR